MNIITLLISLISGAVGGYLAGAILRNFSLGSMGNSILGMLGGGLGGLILQATGLVTGGGGGVDIGPIISNVLGGGAGGGILMVLIGLIRGAMARS